MLVKITIAFGLMAACVVIHASGVTWALGQLDRTSMRGRRFWRTTTVGIGLATRMVICHLAEIALWALLYLSTQAMRDLPSSLYFSAVTYTTTGYGDLVLPGEWRLVGGVEALTGILMCGWSTAFFFAIVGKLHER